MSIKANSREEFVRLFGAVLGGLASDRKGLLDDVIDEAETITQKAFERVDALYPINHCADVYPKYARGNNEVCPKCNDPAGTVYVRIRLTNGVEEKRCLRDDCKWQDYFDNDAPIKGR